MCVEGMINGWTREDTNQLSGDLREEREREREREKKKKEKSNDFFFFTSFTSFLSSASLINTRHSLCDPSSKRDTHDKETAILY